MALDKKMVEKPDLPFGKYIADRAWRDVIRGSTGAYGNWQKLWRLAEMFDEEAPLIIEICGGLILPDIGAVAAVFAQLHIIYMGRRAVFENKDELVF
jgi:hypothetical protein